MSSALPAMLDRTIADVMRAPPTAAPRDAVLESYGQLSLGEAKEVLSEALRDVIFPGFESLGIELGPAHEHVRARGWL